MSDINELWQAHRENTRLKERLGRLRFCAMWYSTQGRELHGMSLTSDIADIAIQTDDEAAQKGEGE